MVPVDPLIELIVNYTVIPTSFSFNYTVVEGFDQSLGKFPNTLGNVAIVDCHSVGLKVKDQLATIA